MAKRKKHTARENTALPEVQAALICEKVLVDKDGRHSAITIYDTITVNVPSTVPTGVGVAEFDLLLAFKSGDARGKRKLRIVGIGPNKNVGVDDTRVVEFRGDEAGVIFTMRTRMFVKEPGLYWFSVFVNKSRITRIPLRIRFVEHPPPKTLPQTKVKKKKKKK